MRKSMKRYSTKRAGTFVPMTRKARLLRILEAMLKSKVGTVLPLAAALVSAGTASAGELPMVRVVLSSAGLAQFTHAGTATAGSSIDLAVRLDQVDDILKSLTVLDKAGGVGAVSLPGKAPLTELFRDLPFGPDALKSPPALLNALVGTEVELGGQVSVKGRVFRVEPEEIALPDNGGTTRRHRLSLMTDKGLVQAILEDVETLRFSDPQAKAQIERALAGLGENRAKERRKVSIGILGEGTRNVAISYVVAAPVWKTAYRLVLPKDGGGKARLQGWAVVENLTGGDWKDVELMLVSGNPVALHQPLYTAFFGERIEVPVTGGMRLLPRRDDADDAAAPAAHARAKSAPKMAAPARPMAAPPQSQFAQMQRRSEAAGMSGMAAMGGMAGMGGPDSTEMAVQDPLSTAANAAEAVEASTQLLYRFPAKLSLATGHTMMVPFIDREIEAHRTWLYQPETNARRPLAAVRVRNDGDSGIPAGIVTTFDTYGDGSMSFAGDAQLPLLPKGSFKFVTFALDSKTDIRREDKGIRSTTLGKAINGELTVTTRSRRTFDYEVTSPPEEDREIVVEEMRQDGWAPTPEMKAAVEETATRLRYRVVAPKGQTTKATLVLERTDRQSIMLTELGTEEILARVRGLDNESAPLKEMVARLGTLVGEINKAMARRTQLETERKKIGEDQERLRRNLQSVGQGSDLGRRYVEALKAQEDRLAEISRLDHTIEEEMAEKRKGAEELARQLVL